MKWAKLFALGAVVATLYGLLFAYEREVVQICARGGWWFLFPVGVAFLLSFFHGAFTGLFWHVLGVQAKNAR